MTLWQLFQAGGFTMYLLMACSALSLGIIVERIIYFRLRASIDRREFMEQISKELGKGNIKNALEMCKKAKASFANVAAAGLHLHGHNEVVISNAMQREVTIETMKLERYTGVVGTIGSTAVYVGLFGTVLGIMRAFQDIAASGFGGINVVINGIAEALVCTAAGLAVAVPAVIAFNYFSRTIDNFITDMELCASETMDLLNATKND
ncbi:MAG: MotA/TolQ/ExbB proton channel family protein [Candidatus Omnitrophica bacterium]|nr:MotA/TolQ/ExbB proton channel family protein [Candidatus Omnitrophota bacterium]